MVDVMCAELPLEGTRVHADVVIRAGGTTVNAAIAAVAAGADATVVGRVGSDPSAELVSAALAERNIAELLAHDPELPTGVAVALGSTVVAHRGANAQLSPEDIPERLDAEALLVSGFALFQTGSRDASRTALDRFNGRWAAVVLATAEEARAVTGSEPEEAARALASRFELAVVKLGEEGAIAARGDRMERAAAVPVVRRSAFGAGDAFAGALLVALTQDDSLERALELACEAGARAAATQREIGILP